MPGRVAPGRSSGSWRGYSGGRERRWPAALLDGVYPMQGGVAMRILGIVASGLGLLLGGPATAQITAPFCLVSETGQKSCFYYSLQACQQATVALGGMCAANAQAQTQTLPQAQMPPSQKMGPLAGMNYVQQAGEQGRIRGEEQREARLRAELLEAQIARERAATAALHGEPASADSLVFRCTDAAGAVFYSAEPAEGCAVVRKESHIESPGQVKPSADLLDEESKANIYRMADEFAACAGVWDFVAQLEESAERPASARQAKDTANGAISASTYLAAMIHHTETPQDRKAYGHFMPMFEGKRESSTTHMFGMVERQDLPGIELRLTFCGGMLEFQEEIVSEMRRHLVP